MTTPAAPAPGTTPARPASSSPKAAAPSPRAAAPAKLAAGLLKALTAALACENAAVWAYGLVAAYDPDDADEINSIRAGHLARRDATATLTSQGGGTVSQPAAAYALPKPVTDPKSALALAVILETECTAAWRAVIGATDDLTMRSVGLAGLSDSAVWLTTIKIAGKSATPTVPFPGAS